MVLSLPICVQLLFRKQSRCALWGTTPHFIAHLQRIHCSWFRILYRWTLRWHIMWLSRDVHIVFKNYYRVKVSGMMELLPTGVPLQRYIFLFSLGKRVLKLSRGTKGNTSTLAATWILILRVLQFVELSCLATRGGWQATKWLLRQQSLE